MSELRVEGMHAGYAGGDVLVGVDLQVPSGTFTTVLGPSGCGKSTLLRVVAGFHAPTAGRVVVGDRVLSDGARAVPPERRRVGIVPQEGALFPHLTVAENIAFGMRRSPGRRVRVGELLELVGLTGLGQRRPAELSGGQQQRVAVARALAPGPALLLLDEPFNSLDAGLRADIRADVRSALREATATAVLVTHDQEEALGMADAVAVMRDGRIVQHAPPAEVYARPVDLGVAMFVGETVVLGATAQGEFAETALGRVPIGRPRGQATWSYGATGVAVLRPEQLVLSASTPAGSHRVLDVIFHGHDATVLLGGGDGGHKGAVRSRVQGRDDLRPGDQVDVRIEGAAMFFIG